MLIAYILATIIFLGLILFVASPGTILLILSISADSEHISSLDELIGTTFIIPLLLIIIPATYTSIRLQFYNCFLIDEECGVISAIKRSINTTKGHVAELFILDAILSTIILISIIPMMLGLLISIPLAIIVNRFPLWFPNPSF